MDKHYGLRIRAKYNPKRIDDLRPEPLNCIGKIFEFKYVWLMGEEDPFPKIWALITDDLNFGGYWTPEFDLEIL